MPEIIMPKVGDAMTEGKVVRWYKQAGEKVTKGEPVLEIETDKVNLDLEAEADGTLGDLQAKEGQTNVVSMPQSFEGRRRSSPLARRMARDLGVPLESLQGSGPQGRIIAKDVQSFQGAAPAGRIAGATPPLESKSIPLSAMRRTI